MSACLSKCLTVDFSPPNLVREPTSKADPFLIIDPARPHAVGRAMSRTQAAEAFSLGVTTLGGPMFVESPVCSHASQALCPNSFDCRTNVLRVDGSICMDTLVLESIRDKGEAITAGDWPRT